MGDKMVKWENRDEEMEKLGEQKRQIMHSVGIRCVQILIFLSQIVKKIGARKDKSGNM